MWCQAEKSPLLGGPLESEEERGGDVRRKLNLAGERKKTCISKKEILGRNHFMKSRKGGLKGKSRGVGSRGKRLVLGEGKRGKFGGGKVESAPFMKRRVERGTDDNYAHLSSVSNRKGLATYDP